MAPFIHFFVQISQLHRVCLANSFTHDLLYSSVKELNQKEPEITRILTIFQSQYLRSLIL